MFRKNKTRTTVNQRRLAFEQFEKRLLMAADMPSPLLPELQLASPAITQQQVSLQQPHTEAANLANDYGLDGSGQTIAVIDSGIAYDHAALGGGFGSGHKVVGGWDFAENDADPYDDGPAGYHGTHVAGIIGSTDSEYRGVASGADLVALRVFDDRGYGELEWVEQALQWVHEHKNDFEHPITTVNLSLGTSWNQENSEEWAILEDEFAKLKADGLFISVAAGNSFADIGDEGLSYPAVSQHVVPVASHDDAGNLSDFSQRSQNSLVAPGELLKSTAPSHLFGGALSGQFIGVSGTSQAAPFVAGASAILRQANEAAGVENVDQDLLYQQFRDSADQVYDAVTGNFYYRLNLSSALKAVVNQSGSESFTDIGLISGGESIQGSITRISDVDNFEFIAQSSGQLTLIVSSTEQLSPLLQFENIDVTSAGNTVSLDVVEGQRYQFSIATLSGEGDYNVQFNLQIQQEVSDLPAHSEWGNLISSEIKNQQVNGEAKFAITASRDGILTIQGNNRSQTLLGYEIFDDRGNRVANYQSYNESARFDLQATQGQRFTIKVTGYSSDLDFRVDNLVSVKDGFLEVHGTNQDDHFHVELDRGIQFDINGVFYEFTSSQVDTIHFVGHDGNNSIDLQLGDLNDRVATRPIGTNVSNELFDFLAYNINAVSVDAGGGYDVVNLVDSANADHLNAGADSDGGFASLTGSNYQSNVSGFDVVYSLSSGGNDSASLSGNQTDDLFVSSGNRQSIWVGNSTLLVDNFIKVEVFGGGGNDLANVYDSAGNDRFEIRPGFAEVNTSQYQLTVQEFFRVNAFSTQGTDQITLLGSTAGDSLYSANGMSVLAGDDYLSYSQDFSDLVVQGAGGFDYAQIFDTAGDDYFFSSPVESRLVSTIRNVSASGFEQVHQIANQGGRDRAELFGSNQDDLATIDLDEARIQTESGFVHSIQGVDEVLVDLKGGYDSTQLTGSSAKEFLTASYDELELRSTVQLLRLVNSQATSYDGGGGGDEVDIEEFHTLDLLESLGEKATAYLQDRKIELAGIGFLEAQTVDQAIADYDLGSAKFPFVLKGNWNDI
ncbi:MAG: S8 family serine peptidase [Planctomycetota bacterium]